MAARALSAQVLVVGAGPVGAVLALELAHHNVASMVVERSVAPSSHPKMDYLTGRSMELLRRLGLADPIRRQGIDPDHTTDFLWTLGFHEPPVTVWHHPSVNQVRAQYASVNDGSAPVEPYQRILGSRLERLVRDAARANPLVELREGWTCTDLRLSPGGGVVASVFDPSAGARHVVEAGYLAACDGAGSTVRQCLGVRMDTTGPATQHCSVYFTSRDPALRRYGRAFVTVAAGGLTLVSRDEQDTWTASLPLPADEAMTTDPLGLVRARLGVDFAVQQMLGVSQWEGRLAVAESYRRGAVFLVGDAAHQFYPAGGHGANTGIGDAVDLGWKLAATVNGWAGTGLLDSYQAERRPVALVNRELSAALVETWRRFGALAAAGVPREQLAGLLDLQAHQVDNLGLHFSHRYVASPVICAEPGPAPAWQWHRITPTTWPGGRAPAVRLADGGQLFDRYGPELTLVDQSGTGRGEPLVKEARRRGIPVRHLAIDDPAVRACWERSLVLVRPDQHVAWRGDHAPDQWGEVLDRVTGGKDHVNAA